MSLQKHDAPKHGQEGRSRQTPHTELERAGESVKAEGVEGAGKVWRQRKVRRQRE